jgi:programmed cell death 8 (apoptosis-inducing factor)
MLWSDLGQEIGFEAVGRVDSQLTSVGVFAKSPDATVTSAKPDNYEKGVVFYTDKSEVVVGVLMWNIFNHMSLARKVIRESKKFDDLTEVAKLFELYDKPDEEAKEESKKEVAN